MTRDKRFCAVAMLHDRSNKLFFLKEKNYVLSYTKYFHYSSHETWLPCKPLLGCGKRGNLANEPTEPANVLLT